MPLCQLILFTAIRLIRRGLIVSVVFLFCAPNVFADAQCWINGAMNINFGNTDITNDDLIHSNLDYTCQAPYDASGDIYHVRACVFVQPDEMNTYNPHTLRRWDGSLMHYQIYSDSTRTLLVGPVNSDLPAYSWTMDIPPNSQYSSVFTLYGKIPGRQPGLSSGTYESHFSGGILRWRWSKGFMPTPSVSDCLNNQNGSGGGNVSFFINATSYLLNSCLINSATDLNFGTVTSQIKQNIDQSATITLTCPLGTAWKISLDNGMNALGSQRRMRNERSNYINYQLFRNNARTQSWDNGGILNIISGLGLGQTVPIYVPVYGRMPVQANTLPGNYSDQVTVTLTY